MKLFIHARIAGALSVTYLGAWLVNFLHQQLLSRMDKQFLGKESVE